jgi:hypothetical protein
VSYQPASFLRVSADNSSGESKTWMPGSADTSTQSAQA